MTSSTFILLSGALSFGVPLLWAVYELVSLRRDWGGEPGGGGIAAASLPRRSPAEGRRNTGGPLPACLIEGGAGRPGRQPGR